MAAMKSLVLGAVSQNLSDMKSLKAISVQEFVRDEVLIAPSLDPYLKIAHANRVLSSGKSLFLEASKHTQKIL